jgi:hypothetical protein
VEGSADPLTSLPLVHPVPDKPICCGLSALVSLIEMLALRRFNATGLKITVLTQDWPALTPAVQLFVSEKSPASVPLIAMLVILSAELPVLVNVTVCGELLVFTITLPKSRTFGTSLTVPAEILIVVILDLVVSVADVAVSVTVGLASAAAGPVYVVGLPLAVLEGATLPQLGEQAVPACESAQVTPALAGSFETVAVNCWAMFTGSSAPPGAADTVIARTIRLAEPNAEGFATEAAVMVTAKSLPGGVVGAV